MHTYPDALAARTACIRQPNDGLYLLPVAGRKPIKLVANEAIFATFDDKVFEQAVNAAEAPGVDQLIVGPDGHAGYGAPVGSIMVTENQVYPGLIGPDICCSMSYLQTDVPDSAIADKAIRRALLNAIGERIPTGMGNRQGTKARQIPWELLREVPIWGAKTQGLDSIGIPTSWLNRLERPQQGDISELSEQFDNHETRIKDKIKQIGSLGGGNHFSEAQAVTVASGMEGFAAEWGIHNGSVGMLTHCGSRGFGFQLAAKHFRGLEAHFKQWGMALPGGEKELVYAPVDSPQGQDYLYDMYLGANFATVNHLLINAYLLEAFQEVLPGTKGELVYHVSHNIGREEIVDGSKRWVFRKGATRAFPSGHHDLKGTPYAMTGHPILLPGNPEAGSYIMVGQQGGVKTAYSINHGAGRAMGRNHAKRTLKQADVDAQMLAADILYNGRSYPVDEAPGAYKPFEEVTKSIEQAGLAKVVAKLKARFVVKDSDQSAEGAA